MFLPFEIINFIFYFIFTITTATLFTDCTTALYSAWHKAKMKLEDETWLRENCRDPLFFSNMKSHTNICSEVEANARIGAFWAALHDVVESFKISWHPWIVGWTGYVFCFLLLVYWLSSVCILKKGTVKRKMVCAHNMNV